MKFLSETSELCNDKQHTPVLLLCIKHLIQLPGKCWEVINTSLTLCKGEHEWMVVYVQLNTFLQVNVSFNSTVPTAEIYSDFWQDKWVEMIKRKWYWRSLGYQLGIHLEGLTKAMKPWSYEKIYRQDKWYCHFDLMQLPSVYISPIIIWFWHN